MKTIKVFVSSPGDVQAERTIADRLIRAIAEELGIPVSVQYSNLLRDSEPVDSGITSIEPESGELILCPYFWEYQRFSPELGYQDQIPDTSRFDLVICILWSRLGTKLNPRFRMPDGSEPRSGTEYEIAWAKAQRDFSIPGKKIARVSSSGRSTATIISMSLKDYFGSISGTSCWFRFPTSANGDGWRNGRKRGGGKKIRFGDFKFSISNTRRSLPDERLQSMES